MKSKEKELSVIIVSYNCLPLIKQCIASIDNYNDIGDALEVIIVDNSDDSETIDWLRKERPDITSIDNENRGFGHGNNIGSKAALGKYYLFLNPDTILVEPVFRYALKKFESDPGLGMFGVRLLDAERNRNNSFGLRWVSGLMLTKLNDLCVSLDIFIPSKMFTLGADIFIRRDVFDAIGGFDETFFMYCEEADLCNRVNRQGMKNAFYRDKSIIHLEGKTQKNPNLLRTYKRLTNSRKYYCDKYGLDFRDNLKKEFRYTKLKKFVSTMINRKKQAEAFGEVVDYIQQELEKTKDLPGPN